MADMEGEETERSVPESLSTKIRLSTLNDVSYELENLEELVNRGSWIAILNAVDQARSGSRLSTPHDHLTYMAFRVLALAKLRRFKDALAEVDSLDDLNSYHYRYETHPKIYPGRSGSMVPFVIRWLHALLPIKLGNTSEGLDRFYILLGFVRDRIQSIEEQKTASVRVWKRREYFVLCCIIGQHISRTEFGTCLELFKDLSSKKYVDPSLIGKLGIVQMQVGDSEGAKASFDWVEKMVEERVCDVGNEQWVLGETELRNLINRNRALVFIVGKDYISAVREYEECIQRDPMDVVAINNKALCLMYLRDLSDSIKVLEGALERVPTVALKEPLLVNLCSMYELAYVNHSEIKRTLGNWLSQVAPDDFDSSCTRI